MYSVCECACALTSENVWSSREITFYMYLNIFLSKCHVDFVVILTSHQIASKKNNSYFYNILACWLLIVPVLVDQTCCFKLESKELGIYQLNFAVTKLSKNVILTKSNNSISYVNVTIKPYNQIAEPTSQTTIWISIVDFMDKNNKMSAKPLGSFFLKCVASCLCLNLACWAHKIYHKNIYLIDKHTVLIDKRLILFL